MYRIRAVILHVCHVELATREAAVIMVATSRMMQHETVRFEELLNVVKRPVRFSSGHLESRKVGDTRFVYVGERRDDRLTCGGGTRGLRPLRRVFGVGFLVEKGVHLICPKSFGELFGRFEIAQNGLLQFELHQPRILTGNDDVELERDPDPGIALFIHHPPIGALFYRVHTRIL